jgi:hypothetical protein
MKRSLTLTLLLLSAAPALLAQYKPVKLLNPDPGYIMINEFNAGFGLGTTDVPNSKYFYGFNTIHGYQVNQYFLVAAGTGVSFYDKSTMVPAFLDLRYRIYVSQWTLYVTGEGGFLFDVTDNESMRMFLNPTFGLSYTVSRNLALNLGSGLFTQFGDWRDSFFNVKLGVTYKF